MWSELNCTLGNWGGRGREGDSEGTPVNIFTKGRSGILDSSIPSYRSIMTPSVNTRALMTLKVTIFTRAYGSCPGCQHFVSQFSQTVVHVTVTGSAVN